MSALDCLGSVNQKMGDFESARLFHERHEDQAKLFDVVEEVKKANVELYKVSRCSDQYRRLRFPFALLGCVGF